MLSYLLPTIPRPALIRHVDYRFLGAIFCLPFGKFFVSIGLAGVRRLNVYGDYGVASHGAVERIALGNLLGNLLLTRKKASVDIRNWEIYC
ncbi:G-type lectin S-receptor-like serine/threonine-protein kinase B120 [Olea europaea subsp. europaea]|uniref:G-type lectin S-receptor-like serine/threonine-protein kinase B120 n=1 Tax=Olea europaea subsp. europaea TaxID=158383 RepID=A0A8S0R5A5_OLEEU|nr:G-type lectin S-receptor-like serine/threonine-protein kinase B120 [Olea europaea subsp. europaea]